MATYTNIVNTNPVTPSDVSYQSYNFYGELELNWPQALIDSPNLVANFIDIDCSLPIATIQTAASNVLTITLQAGHTLPDFFEVGSSLQLGGVSTTYTASQTNGYTPTLLNNWNPTVFPTYNAATIISSLISATSFSVELVGALLNAGSTPIAPAPPAAASTKYTVTFPNDPLGNNAYVFTANSEVVIEDATNVGGVDINGGPYTVDSVIAPTDSNFTITGATASVSGISGGGSLASVVPHSTGAMATPINNAGLYFANITNVITMPPANQVSVGQSVIFNNKGAASVSIVDNAGVDIIDVASGACVLLVLNDNSAVAPTGAWTAITLGGTVTPADAAAIAGFGLIALNSTLNTNMPVTLIDNTNIPYSVTASNRAAVLAWTAGNGDLNLPAANSVTNGFFFSVSNYPAEAAVISVIPDGSDTIDNVAGSYTLNDNESVFFVSNGVDNWATVGHSSNAEALFQWQISLISVGNGDNQIYAPVSQRSILVLSGTITIDSTIILNGVDAFYYTIINNTGGNTNAINLFVRAANGGGSTLIPPGCAMNFVLTGAGLQPSNSALPIGAQLTTAGSTETFPALRLQTNNSTLSTTQSGLYNRGDGSINVAGYLYWSVKGQPHSSQQLTTLNSIANCNYFMVQNTGAGTSGNIGIVSSSYYQVYKYDMVSYLRGILY